MGQQNQSRGFPATGQFGNKPPEVYPGQRRRNQGMGGGMGPGTGMGMGAIPKPGGMGMGAPAPMGGAQGGQGGMRQAMGPGGMPISVGESMYPGAETMQDPTARTMQPPPRLPPQPQLQAPMDQSGADPYAGMTGSQIFERMFRR